MQMGGEIDPIATSHPDKRSHDTIPKALVDGGHGRAIVRSADQGPL